MLEKLPIGIPDLSESRPRCERTKMEETTPEQEKGRGNKRKEWKTETNKEGQQDQDQDQDQDGKRRRKSHTYWIFDSILTWHYTPTTNSNWWSKIDDRSRPNRISVLSAGSSHTDRPNRLLPTTMYSLRIRHLHHWSVSTRWSIGCNLLLLLLFLLLRVGLTRKRERERQRDGKKNMTVLEDE